MNEQPAPPAWRPDDTSLDAWTIMVQRWRDMEPGAKALLANQMSIDVDRLARAGILATEPDADEARVRYLLMCRRYGRALADAASDQTG